MRERAINIIHGVLTDEITHYDMEPATARRILLRITRLMKLDLKEEVRENGVAHLATMMGVSRSTAYRLAKAAVFLLLCFLPALLSAQGVRHDNTAWNTNPYTVSGASVSVCPDNNGQAFVIANAPTGATESGPLVTITIVSGTLPAGFVTGAWVNTVGVGVAAYNGTNKIVSATTTSYSYISVITGLGTSGSGIATIVLPPVGFVCGPVNTALFTDQKLTQSMVNPFSTDILGGYGFYAAQGNYQVSISTGGTASRTYSVSASCPAVGACAVKNYTADKMQYVSTQGLDANDGLSWGTAKLTPTAAMTTIGTNGGTVNVASGSYPGPVCASFPAGGGFKFKGWGSPTSVPFAGNMTTFVYTATCVINDSSSNLFENIAFDMSTCVSACGIEIRSTTGGSYHNTFIRDMFLQCGGGGASGVPCIKLNASGGTNANVAFSLFQDCHLYLNNTHGSNPGPAIGFQFIGSGPVNLGSFATVNVVENTLVRGGIQGVWDQELNSDSNYSHNVQGLQEWNVTPANSYIVAFNLNNPTIDQDANNNNLQFGITGVNFTSFVIEGQATGNIVDAITALGSTGPTVGVQVQGGVPQFCGRVSGLNGVYSANYCYIGTQEIYSQQTIFLGGPGVTNYTGTNTTYATVDSTNLCKVLTVPRGFKVIISIEGNAFTNTAAALAAYAITDVGSTCGGAGVTPLTESFVFPPGIGSGFLVPMKRTFVFNGDGAVHSFALQAKTFVGADAWGLTNNATSNAPTMIIVFVPST